MTNSVWRIALIFLVAVTTGCGSGLSLVPASGTITLNGEPLAGAGVVFLPKVPNPDGESSNGVTGSDGRYEILTNGSSGVVPGQYRVMVSKTTMDPSLIPDEFKDDPFMAEQLIAPEKKGKRKSADSAPSIEKIEAAFPQEVSTSGGTYDFDVKSKNSRSSDSRKASK